MVYDHERMQRLMLGSLLGLATVAAVAVLHHLLAARFPGTAAFIPFVIPVMIAGWYGGLWPSLLATLASLVVMEYFFVEPVASLQIAQSGDAVSLLLFLCCGVTIGVLCERLHAARRSDERRRLDLEREIDQRCAAEQSVQQRERQLREAHDHVVTALEGMTDAFNRFDRNWKYVYVNTAAERIAGRTRAELLGQTLWETEPEIVGTRIEKEYRRAIADQVIVAWDHYDEVRGRWLAIRAFPTSDGGLASFFRDITHQRQSEEALAESQRLEHARRIELETVMASAPAAIMIAHDIACSRITGNPAAYAMLRLPPGANIAQPETSADDLAHFVIHRNGAPIAADELPMRLAAQTGQPVASQELEFRFNDGSSVWVFGNAQPLADEQGVVRGAVSTFVDITARIQAEKRLRQSERLYRAIGESIDYGVWVADADGKSIYMSPAFLRLVGLTQEECSEFNWANVLHPDEAEQTLAEWKECVRTRANWDREHRFKGVDGNWHPVLARGVPILDEHDRVVCWAGINLDISRLKRAEEAVLATQEHLRLVTDTMSAPVTRCSRDFRYLWVSPPYADWLDRPAEDIIGRTIAEVLGQEAFDRLRPQLDRVLSGAEVRYEEEVNYRGIGKRWVDAVYTPTVGSDGVVTGWVAVVLDITERKRAEEALKQADRRKNEFLAMLAHELRNPLAPIRNAIELLQQKGSPDDETAWSRDVIQRQIGQMARLLDDLLDVSRITRNKLELRRQQVSLASVIEGAVETSRPLIEFCGHELSIRLPAEPIQLDVDPIRMAQVFSNLLNNAAKYTDRGGKISLHAERQGSEVAITIADNGIGISGEMLPRLFEMFTQAQPALERSQGGLGIGLSLVKGLVELHDGSIGVHSAGPGKGSEFTVRLPLVIGDVSLPSASLLDGAAVSNGVPRRVLVVDDNRDGADSLTALLTVRGHEVHAAYDGQEGVEAAEALRPDIVLLDIGMPRLNGYDAARYIRQQEWGRDLMLVALTGWGQEDDRRRTKAAGFNHHLVKPVDPAQLLQLLAELEPSGV